MNFKKLVQLSVIGESVSILVLSSSGQSISSMGRPAWMSNPKTQVNAETTISPETGLRTTRAKMFNSPSALRSSAADLTKAQSDSSGSGVFSDYSQPEALPVQSSSVIASGTIVAQQPYLSEDRTQVYSELAFAPDVTLKNSTPEATTGKLLTILNLGGALKLSNGRVVKSVDGSGSNPVNLNRRYLLFLQYLPQAKAFSVVKAWDLSGAKPQELDQNGEANALVTSDSNNTTTEDSLLALIKSRVSGK